MVRPHASIARLSALAVTAPSATIAVPTADLRTLLEYVASLEAEPAMVTPSGTDITAPGDDES